MKNLSAIVLLLVICVLSATASAELSVGDAAPDFTLAGSDGQSHTLADLRGQFVVLAFFPKAYTSG